MRIRFKLLGLLCSACAIAAHADSAPFDLAGPKLEITVSRGQTTLPISEVPNLFTHPVRVPDGFPGYALPVPHSVNGQLYVKLRDDPLVANPVAMSVVSLPLSAKEAARAAARLAAAASVDRPAAVAAGTAYPSDNSGPSLPAGQMPAEQGPVAATPPAASPPVVGSALHSVVAPSN